MQTKKTYTGISSAWNATAIIWEKQIKNSSIRHCGKCGNNYLYMTKYNGECYLCLKGMRAYCQTEI